MKGIYFDNAGTTLMDKGVVSAMQDSMLTAFGNPSSVHQLGRDAKAIVEGARKTLAAHLKSAPGELIFTSGGTEANNLILRNAVTNLKVTTIISSTIEHAAVLQTIKQLKAEFGIVVKYVDLTASGAIDYDHLALLLKESSDKKLVSLMFVNNEVGNLLDIDRVAALCVEYQALFHSDTVQGIGRYPIDLERTPIDFIVGSAHKFHGPKGVGFAFFRKGHDIQPMLHGGNQERGMRSGTENVHGILGMAKALDISMEHLSENSVAIKELKAYFIHSLEQSVPGVAFNGDAADLEKSSYTILSVRFPKEVPLMLFSFDLKGIAVSGGSACQSGSAKGSHVLEAIIPEKMATTTSIRFSFSKYNTKEEVDYTIAVIKELLFLE